MQGSELVRGMDPRIQIWIHTNSGRVPMWIGKHFDADPDLHLDWYQNRNSDLDL